MSSSLALNLPQIQKLRERAIPGRGMREQATRFDEMAQVVREQWDEMPYALKRELKEIAERFEPRFPKPQNISEWALLVSAVVAVPFTIAWDLSQGHEDSITRYSMSLARFIASVNIRVKSEESEAKRVWNEMVSSDPQFYNSYKMGLEERKTGEFIEADWTTKRLDFR